MKINAVLLSVSFLVSFSSFTLQAATRNACDDLVDLKKSDEAIEKCIKRLGPSETYTITLQKKKWSDSQAVIKESEEAAKKANVQSKKFTEKEIEDQLGMPIYAYKIEYSKNVNGVPERLTKGDTLCKFLGFEKSLKSSFSGFIKPENAYENGFIIDDYWIGKAPKEPEIFKDKSVTYYILKYKEITCAKVISKDVPGASDVLREVAEDIGSLNPGFLEGASAKKDVTEVDDSQRGKTKPTGSTPFGYVREKPLEDVKKGTSSK